MDTRVVTPPPLSPPAVVVHAGLSTGRRTFNDRPDMRQPGAMVSNDQTLHSIIKDVHATHARQTTENSTV